MCGMSDCSHNRDAAPGEACSPSWPYASICFDKAFSLPPSRGWPGQEKWVANYLSMKNGHGFFGIREKSGGATSAPTCYLGGIPISRLRGLWLVLTVSINSIWTFECLFSLWWGAAHDRRILPAVVHLSSKPRQVMIHSDLMQRA